MGFLDGLAKGLGYDAVDAYNDEDDGERFKEEQDVTKKVAMGNELKRRGYGKQEE